jgi:tetratricopeptide (TPR) repeat protein
VKSHTTPDTFIKQPLFYILSIIFLVILAYFNIFHNQLIQDDSSFISNWDLTNDWLNLPQLLQGELPTDQIGVYRPLRSLFYLLAKQFWGTNLAGYHLFSLVVHLLNTYLVYLIIHRLLPLKQAWAAALIFGLHPLQTEAITFISASFDTASLILALASFYLVTISSSPKKQLLGYAIGIISFFGYEINLVLPLLIVSYWMIIEKQSLKTNLLRLLPFFGGWLIYFYLRSTSIYVNRAQEYLGGSLYYSLLLGIKALGRYIRLMFMSYPQSFVHSFKPGIASYALPQINHQQSQLQSPTDSAIIAVIIGLLLWFLFIKKASIRNKSILTWASVWIGISLLPFLNLIPGSALFAERYAYLSLVGFSMIISVLLSVTKNPRHTLALISIISALMIIKVNQRNQVWHNTTSFWTALLKEQPENWLVFYQGGLFFKNAGDHEQAVSALTHAISLEPSLPGSYLALGETYRQSSNDEAAAKVFEQGLKVDPTNQALINFTLITYQSLSQQSRQSGNLNEAQSYLLKAQSLEANMQ